MQSVSELTEQIKSLLESTFLQVRVTGEVSRPTYHSSGHLYFTLKDDRSSISCVMFKGNNQRLKFRVEEGMAVDVSAGLSVYAPRGSYQLNCVSLEPSGSGALAVAYEQLKKELQEKGYFERSRPLPRFPKHVVLVTSKTGAALQDMLNVAKKRYPLVRLSLVNALVQGDDAKFSIARGLKRADELKADIIIVGRGGGSVEDLWVFNEREVAEAIYKCKTPVVSAVGHAIDTLISDFVADKSAPTPSAAMELILPDINELKLNIDTHIDALKNIINAKLQQYANELHSLRNQLKLFSPKNKIELLQKELSMHKDVLKNALHQKINLFASQLDALEKILKNKDPKNLVKSGYAQIVKEGKVTALDELKKNDEFELRGLKKSIKARVLGLELE